ncbi:MAG TPA: hypothetical protein VK530_18750 [Candidatus Acidoferrum sp.]|nr:hypothetical protein [Candidatus Acidoferrum sp.]
MSVRALKNIVYSISKKEVTSWHCIHAVCSSVGVTYITLHDNTAFTTNRR